MSHNSYNNIKKYAAFIFMVFTVLSGSSDRIDSDSFVIAGKRAFIDMLASNRMLMQDARVSIGQLRAQLKDQDNDGFREFLDANVEDTTLNHIQVYILPLIITAYYLNNIIQKNSIWKNAVF